MFKLDLTCLLYLRSQFSYRIACKCVENLVCYAADRKHPYPLTLRLRGEGGGWPLIGCFRPKPYTSIAPIVWHKQTNFLRNTLNSLFLIPLLTLTPPNPQRVKRTPPGCSEVDVTTFETQTTRKKSLAVRLLI